MSWYLAIQTIFVIAIVFLVGFIIIVLIQLKKTLVGIDELVRQVNTELIPILSKAQTTLDEVNSELSRVNGIVTSIHGVSERVQTTTDAAKKLVASPAIKLSGIAAGLKAAGAKLISRRQKR